MGRFSLQTGVWTGVLGLFFGGTIGVLSAGEDQAALAFVGWLSIAAGVLLAIWGVKVDGEHWWLSFWPTKRGKSPILIARELYLFSTSVVDENGNAWPELEAVHLCFQISNSLKDGKTLRGVAASLWTFTEKLPLRILNGASELRHGDIEFIEIGTVVAPPLPGKSFAPFRPGNPYPVDAVMAEYWKNGGHRTLWASNNPKFGLGDSVTFQTVITAEDFPSHARRFVTDFSGTNAYKWVKVAPRTPE